jgi:DNA-directed RNA polymerase specialized sigma24 family protein
VRHPPLTEPTFRRLLAWLDGGVDSLGANYLEVRRRLIAYFDRRNCASPDELADETFHRVANTLEQCGAVAIMPPARYCYVVARFVFLEEVRRQSAEASAAAPADRLVTTSTGDAEDDAFAIRQRRLERLDRCLNALDAAQHDLIVEYYRSTGRDRIAARRALAARLGITMHALSSRASRIRDQLERCVAKGDRPSPDDRDEDA